MGTAIAVTSGKGGTGKTFLTAAVASCLAALGYRAFCLDADVGLRNLDIALGLADRVMMDFSDVIEGRCRLQEAVTVHPEIPGLYLMAAPMQIRRMESKHWGLEKIIEEAKRQYDFCLIDCPAGLGSGFREATHCADRSIVVTTTDAASLRDAQQAVALLVEQKINPLHLVVNRVRPKHLRRIHRDLDDVMDAVGLPLLGVVPEDEKVILSANQEIPLMLAGRGDAAIACLNIARRLTGQRVPLMRIR